MSLLFDALNRAQGTGAKPLQMQDTPSDISSRSNEGQAKQSDATDAAKTILAATHSLPSGVLQAAVSWLPALLGRLPPGFLRYAAAGLALLAGGGGWYFYQQNQSVPATTQITTPGAEAIIKPLAASKPVAASGVTGESAARQTAPAETAVSTDSSVNKPWTQPVKKRIPKKHMAESASPAILTSTVQHPLNDAYLDLSEGRMDQAEQKYLEVLVQHPHEKDALLGLAVIAQRKMQNERAADLYRQVLREDLGNAAAAAGLVSLSVQADPVAAESQLRELLDIKPAAPEFHYALGGVLARQLRWGEAQQAFFRACSLSPDNALYAYNLAVSLDRLRQPAAALPFYEKASRLAKPGDPTLDREAIGRRIQELKISR